MTQNQVLQLSHSELSKLQLADLPSDRRQLDQELSARCHKVRGSGSYAVVIEHPEDPELVIRISARNDGWIDYALKNQAHEYAPRLFAVACTGSVWISITERLNPLSLEASSEAAIKSAIDAMVMLNKRVAQDLHPNAFSPEELKKHQAWKGLTEFLQQFLGLENCDLKEANIMMRKGVPVANDPIAEMDSEVARSHEKMWMLAQVEEQASRPDSPSF